MTSPIKGMSELSGTSQSMNIKKPDQIIKEIREKVKDWMNYADEVNVAPKLRDEIQASLLPDPF